MRRPPREREENARAREPAAGVRGCWESTRPLGEIFAGGCTPILACLVVLLPTKYCEPLGRVGNFALRGLPCVLVTRSGRALALTWIPFAWVPVRGLNRIGNRRCLRLIPPGSPL